jgi:predicted Zn-dependent peptidase
MATTIMNTLIRGYDVNWLDEYPERVQALDLATVNGAIKKHLHPDKLVLVKAGTVAEAVK